MINKNRLIYAKEAVELINGIESLPWEEETEGLVNSLTTVDAVEVVHARWETKPHPYRTLYTEISCSACGEWKHGYAYEHENMKYCPNCGAKMDG